MLQYACCGSQQREGGCWADTGTGARRIHVAMSKQPVMVTKAAKQTLRLGSRLKCRTQTGFKPRQPGKQSIMHASSLRVTAMHTATATALAAAESTAADDQGQGRCWEQPTLQGQNTGSTAQLGSAAQKLRCVVLQHAFPAPLSPTPPARLQASDAHTLPHSTTHPATTPQHTITRRHTATTAHPASGLCAWASSVGAGGSGCPWCPRSAA
jgi:hypothetical protein